MVRDGSKWSGSDGRVFVVINTAVLEEHRWIYYRAEQPVDGHPAEYSCYEESFLSRFTPLPE